MAFIVIKRLRSFNEYYQKEIEENAIAQFGKIAIVVQTLQTILNQDRPLPISTLVYLI